jgi:quinol monooxygenase YgiN
MVIITVKPKIKDEFKEEYIQCFKDVQQHVIMEMGCYDYVMNEDVDTGELFLFERWESQDDVSVHLETEHMRKYFEATAHMKAGDAEVNFYDAEPMDFEL